MSFGRRLMRTALALVSLCCVLGATQIAWAGDPRLEWYTIESGRFRVHFHGGLEPMAQRTLKLANQIEDEVVRIVGSRPSENTEIVLVDSSDSANGLTWILPYSNIRLFVTAPDDSSALGQYDDWLPALLSHEDAHAVHIGAISGIPALLNAIIGKTAVPIELQPRWLKEGLAVYVETRLGSGGRLRNPAFDMMLRADVLDNRFLTLDQITGEPLRWPGGAIAYLYGGKFVEFLANLYGPSVLAATAQDSSDEVMPFAVSRPFYRATGRTIEELYAAFKASTERRVTEQLERVRARGLREGRPITVHGRVVSSPRVVPEPCRRGGLAEATAIGSRSQGESRTAALLYYRDDGHDRAGYYELPLREDLPAGDAQETLVSRGTGDNASIAPDCSLWFESTAPSERRYYFNDIFRQLPGTTSPSGTDDSRIRVTVGRRAMDPEVSPDGRHLVYVTNRAGTTTLRIAAIDENGNLVDERALVAAGVDEQVYTPRYSPDGSKVAYSAWAKGGFRDIRIVDVASGQVTQLFRDRALDQQPVFAPDGNRLYFSSDRSGISNIYAYDWVTAKLWQVTNVTTGAYMPELSRDGRQLFYVGYSSRGYDLYAMPIDERAFLEPLSSAVVLDDRILFDDRGALPVRPYSALATLRPRSLGFSYSSDGSGQRLLVSTTGSDVAWLHSIGATAVFEPEGDNPDLYLSYGYSRLPVGFTATAYRLSDPNYSYKYGTYESAINQLRIGASTGISIPFYHEFAYQSLWIGYAAEHVGAVLPTGEYADPFAPVPQVPRRGISSSLRFDYYYSNVESSTYGVGAERGMTTKLTIAEAHRGLGSELEGTNVRANVSGYLLLPWLRHHVLAMSGTAAANTGNAFSGYSLGGYQNSAILNDLFYGISQGRTSLRGYPTGRFRGDRLLSGQAEYRFPIWILNRGVSTLPVFMQRFGGAFGVDGGGAFDSFDPHAFGKSLHWGLGGELWFDLIVGYHMSSRVLFGYAAGKGEGAFDGGTSYLVVGGGL